jgi:hypothetical protein
MANSDHLEVLRQGREAIDKWRESNPSAALDLSGADLQGAGLAGVDLSDADLSRANLSGADLSGAVLTNADLTEANLRDANLDGADLKGTILEPLENATADNVVLVESDWLGEAPSSSVVVVDNYQQISVAKPRLVAERPKGQRPPRIALTGIHIRSFRQIVSIDADIPENIRVVCLVGPNGSGKSSVLSFLAESLCQLTKESAPDLNKAPLSSAREDDWFRSLSTGEINTTSPAYALRLDWSIDGQPASFLVAVRKSEETKGARSLFPDLFQGEDFDFQGDKWVRSEWTRKSDPIPYNVLLIRPSDRSEKAS